MNSIQQVKQVFGDYLPLTSNIDLNLLPEFVRDSVNLFLLPKNTDTPISILILNLLVKTSQLVSHNRVSHKSLSEITSFPINLYGIVIADSNIGKGRSLGHIDGELFDFFNKSFDKQVEDYKIGGEGGLYDREKEAKRLYPKNEIARKKYIEETAPRVLIRQFGSNTTVEGFSEIREAYQNAKFGAPFVLMQEFAHYISTQDNAKTAFISALTEVYDKGNLEVKLIKSEKNTKETRGIPTNALLQTSPFKITEGKGFQNTIEVLGTGIARRAFVCYPINDEIPRMPENADIFEEIKQEIEQKKESNKSLNYLVPFFEYAFKRSSQQNTVITNEEAEVYCGIYKNYCHRRCFNIKNKAIKSEVGGRSWKMLKLAGVLAYFNDVPESERLCITKENILHAVYLAEIFGIHFERFCNVKNETPSQKMFDFFENNINTWFDNNELRAQKFVNKDEWKRWKEENLPLVEEMAEKKGYILQDESFGKNGHKWRLIQENPPMPESIEFELSLTTQKGEKISHFQETKVIDFSELAMFVNSSLVYSTGTYKDNKRSIATCTGQANLVVFDVDNGMTIEEAQSRLCEYKHLITTTKSHQKEKNGQVCDRFRIFLPTADNLPHENKRYKNILKNIAEELDLFIDTPVVETSRYFFGNPDGIEFYNEGTKLLNWTLFEKEKETNVINERKPAVKTYKGSGKSMIDVLGTDEALRRYQFYDATKGCVAGNVDNFLRRISVWLRDAGVSQSDKEKELIWLFSLSPIANKTERMKENIRRLARN